LTVFSAWDSKLRYLFIAVFIYSIIIIFCEYKDTKALSPAQYLFEICLSGFEFSTGFLPKKIGQAERLARRGF